MTILILITLLLIKHFVADFPLQTGYMVVGKGKEKDWFFPLLSHSLVHGALTAACIFAVTRDIVLSLLIGAIETVVHFSIDRIKASPNMFGRFKDTSKPLFWNLLGLDQLAHNLCYVLIVYVVARYL